jgi:hypothetical protein
MCLSIDLMENMEVRVGAKILERKERRTRDS